MTRAGVAQSPGASLVAHVEHGDEHLGAIQIWHEQLIEHGEEVSHALRSGIHPSQFCLKGASHLSHNQGCADTVP